ncbi:hypothetical protein D3C87_1606810 [compost metagenome]
MPSAMAPAVNELVSWAAQKARLAGGSQKMRMMNRTGMVTRVSSPSQGSRLRSTATMPNSSTMSPTEITEVSRNSCMELTSPWRRLIKRPTSVLSMKLKDTRWSWANMARRMSNSTCSATCPTWVSCTQEAPKLNSTAMAKAPTAQSRLAGSPPGTRALSMALPMISGMASWVPVNTSTAMTER